MENASHPSEDFLTHYPSQNVEEAYTKIVPRLGNYEWLWKVLRLRAQKSGYLPNKLHAFFVRFHNRAKPYFVTQTRDGLFYVGDVHETLPCGLAVF